MEYIVDDTKFSLSYSELKERYLNALELEDLEFLERLPELSHLACVICWLKDCGREVLSDRGLIHELIHLMHFKSDPEKNYDLYVKHNLERIRKDFEIVLKLA